MKNKEVKLEVKEVEDPKPNYGPIICDGCGKTISYFALCPCKNKEEYNIKIDLTK